MNSRILIGLAAGSVGGFLGWLLQENLISYEVTRNVPTGAVKVVPLSTEQMRTLIYCVGGSIGLLLGAVDGLLAIPDWKKLLRGMVVGMLCGIAFGYIGFSYGNIVYVKLGGRDAIEGPLSMLAFSQQVIARAFGWALMGAGLGAGSAVATLSWKRVGQGAAGGFLGGFLGGFAFDLVAQGSSPMQTAVGASGIQESGGPSRLIGFTLIGGLSGFFIGLVEELFKQAWVKVLVGRNEGREILLYKPFSILGRDERCDIPLFGDPAIGVQHAGIRAERSSHVLVDAGTPGGTAVNGQRIASGGELLLQDGDVIQVGSRQIQFREKATAHKVSRQEVDVPRPRVVSPQAMGPGGATALCPFCGGVRDAAGRCQCSLPEAHSTFKSGDQETATRIAPENYSGMNLIQGNRAGYAGRPTALVTEGEVLMPRLVGIEGPYTGEVFLLTAPSLEMGRGTDRDIVLAADNTISRNHARLVNENGDRVLYDNGSSNGTYVNGMRVTMQVLVPGDVIQLGQHSKFRFE